MLQHFRQHILVLTALLLMSVNSTAQVSLDKRRPVYDRLTSTWLCSVPASVFGTDFTATITADSTDAVITIDGQEVPSGTTYTFASVSGDAAYHLTVSRADTTLAGDLCFTFNPIFELTGDFNDNYQITSITAHMPDFTAPSPMFCKVKHRGGSTNVDPREKRNYHIKFLNADTTKMDRKFFGLRNDNSWLLDAGQIDMLRIRNRVATELWMDMVSKPYYADREPKALLGVRGDFIEVFLNGKYHGIYALTEALDRKQMKLAKYDEDSDSIDSADRFHGMLWKSKQSDACTRFESNYRYDNNLDTWGGFEVKYPDPDDVMPTRYETLVNAVRFVNNSSNNEFRAQVDKYFDIPVIMDYYIFIHSVLALDNGVKNIYWAVYDQAVDKKLTMAAWDLDCTFGQYWHNSPLHNNTARSTANLSTVTRLLIRLHELNPDSFAVKAVERYRLLRSTVLHPDNIKQRFHQRLEPLYNSGAVARETRRWSGVYDLARQQLDFPAEMQFIDQWVDERINYLDKGRFSTYIKGDSNRDGVVDVTDVNRLISMILINDYPFWYEDMNDDDLLDITDVNAVINIILGKDNGQ